MYGAECDMTCDANCADGRGVCDDADGSCICTPGFTGSDCSTGGFVHDSVLPDVTGIRTIITELKMSLELMQRYPDKSVMHYSHTLYVITKVAPPFMVQYIRVKSADTCSFNESR